jgi:hypothetical protein
VRRCRTVLQHDETRASTLGGCSRLLERGDLMSRHHEVWPEPQNVHWGFHSAELKPVLTIEPGDLVTLHTVTGGELDQPPPIPSRHHARTAARVAIELPLSAASAKGIDRRGQSLRCRRTPAWHQRRATRPNASRDDPCDQLVATFALPLSWSFNWLQAFCWASIWRR